jgi:UDP-MurNAc hydroxylase
VVLLGEMKIQLISHASILIKSTDVCIWTDPWLFGKAFNESWSLFPEPAFRESILEEADYIFISHEHPDHFHIPTLKSLPNYFKEHVIVLYQENNSNKMFQAFRRLGFIKVRSLPHREIMWLSRSTRIYCYQVGQMDSCLGVMSADKTVLNINDAEINSKDCQIILKDIGDVDVILNQFSIAGYSGLKDYQKYLPIQAKRILKSMVANHQDLHAKVTIPFASFIYFSSEDNKYVNEFANKPRDVYDYFVQNGEDTVILYSGDCYEVGVKQDSSHALKRFDELYSTFDKIPYDPIISVPLEKIIESFDNLVRHLHNKFPKPLLSLLRPVKVRIPDIERSVIFSISKGTLKELGNDEEVDLLVNSQPLYFGFTNPFGIQTLGVSGRYTVLRNFPNWRLHRILFALNNAEFYFRPKYLFTSKNLKYVWKRLRGARNQVIYQFQRMR